MKSKSVRILRLSSGLLALLAMQGLSACGDVKDLGGDGDGDSDAESGGGPSTGRVTAATGGGPSTGGTFPASGGASPAGGTGGVATGGGNQGGEGGMGGEGMGGEIINGTGGFALMPCPAEYPTGDCELGEGFICQHPLYGFVTPTCTCFETAGYDEPQWHCQF